MKPTPFEYHRPSSVEEATTLLEEHQDAELMAGNQSLGIVMANRFASPEHIVDLNGLTELSYITVRDERVEMGAMTRHRDVERSDDLARLLPILPEAASQIAGPSVRNRGTVGGSVAEADPAGNYPAALRSLDATLELASADGTREVSVHDFFVGYMFTDLRENEVITSVRVPREPFPVERTGMAFLELKRAAQTFPTISAAAVVVVDDPNDEDPSVVDARVSLANAADVPLRVRTAETAVEQEPLTEETLTEASEAATDAADPIEEMHADRTFKNEIAGEYTRRALRTAYRRVVDRSDTDTYRV